MSATIALTSCSAQQRPLVQPSLRNGSSIENYVLKREKCSYVLLAEARELGNVN